MRDSIEVFNVFVTRCDIGRDDHGFIYLDFDVKGEGFGQGVRA